MGLFGKPAPEQVAAKAEKAVAREQHRAYQEAGNGAARLLRGDGGLLVHDMLSEATEDAERDVPWWRR